MGLFLTRARGPAPGRSGAGVGLSPRLDAAGEALAPDAAGRRPETLQVCAAAGRELAADGVSLDHALDSLRSTSVAVTGRDPAYAVVRALAAGWSDATLGYLQELTCEDPLTGLASLAHLRSRIEELFRDQAAGRGTVRDHHALLLLETVDAAPDAEVFGAALRTARLAETARTVFPGGITAGRIGRERVAVVVRRDGRSARRLVLARTLLAGVTPPVRVWVESFPLEADSATDLLDELVCP